MMKQKVLFFDIDGTLIWSYGGIQEIPQGVQKELKRLKEQGHKLFICSGRPKAMLDQKWWDGTFDGILLASKQTYTYLHQLQTYCHLKKLY